MNQSGSRAFLPKKLFRTEGAALCAAFGGHVAAAAAHTDAFGLALAVVVVGAVLRFTADGSVFAGRFVRGGIGPSAGLPLLKGRTAGLCAFPGGRAVHLDAGQAAEVVAVVLTGSDLTIQFVHEKAPL